MVYILKYEHVYDNIYVLKMSVYTPLRMIRSLPRSLPKTLPDLQPCIQAYERCAQEVHTIDKWLKSAKLSQNDLVSLKYRTHAYPQAIDIYMHKIAALDQRISSRVTTAAAEAWSNLDMSALDHDVFTQTPCQTLPREFEDVYRKWYVATGLSFEQLINICNLFRTWNTYDFSATAVPVLAARNRLVHTANAIATDVDSFNETKTIFLSSPFEKSQSQFLAHTALKPLSPLNLVSNDTSSLDVYQSLCISQLRHKLLD